jgi:hypothetical protein
MRVGIVLVFVAVLGCGIASAASADPFLDLPGMGAATDATTGKTPDTAVTKESDNADAPADVDRMSTPDSDKAVKSTVDPSLTKTITNLPGGSGLPIFSDLARAATRTNSALPDVLLVLAAIGTATAIGMLWAVRRRFDGSR